MSREEERRINEWSHEYSSSENTASNYARTRGYWHDPHDPVEFEKIRNEEMRLNDIRDTYRMMEKGPPIMMKLQSMRNDMINARGTCTEGEPEKVEEKEEPEGEEFIFDPKELDI